MLSIDFTLSDRSCAEFSENGNNMRAVNNRQMKLLALAWLVSKPENIPAFGRRIESKGVFMIIWIRECEIRYNNYQQFS